MTAEWTRPDGTPLPPHALRRLERRAWRWKTSWWILPPLLTFGVLPWVGYLWAGIKTARPKYYVSGGIWLAISLTWGLILPAAAPGAVPVVAMSCVSLATIQAVVMNRQYLVERAIIDL
ncbi:hypothetical protein [Demequina rhizosphaerae]|uniref:hypothetical protein n=1 Tax=Demequina rhizosphaerae TaxID=1638985 RepID=UPI0007849521|nr:hypothetical protein [Demequina rhizosphaerae]